MRDREKNGGGPDPRTKAVNDTEKDVVLSGPTHWSWKRLLPVAIMMALGTAFFVSLFFLVRAYERERQKDLFGRVAQSQIQSVVRRTTGDVEALLSVKNFFEASRQVNHDEFRQFVQGPLSWHAEIESFEWMPMVESANREAFEARHGIRIHELDPNEREVAAGERSVYFPLLYSEAKDAPPYKRGYDAASEPGTRKAIAVALSKPFGQLAATDRFALPHGPNAISPGNAVRLLVPIYASTLPFVPPESAPDNLMGILAAVVRPSVMISKTIYASTAEKLNVSLFDRSAPDSMALLEAMESNMLVPRPNSLSQAMEELDDMTVVESFPVADRVWTIITRPSHGFVRKGDWEAWSVLLGGLTLTALLCSYLYTLLGQNAYVENVITRRTRELAKMNVRLQNEIAERERGARALRNSEAHYHSLVDTVPMNILRKNLEGRITFGNRLYCETMGIAPNDIKGKTDFDLFPKELAEKYVEDDRRVIESRRIFQTVEMHRRPNGTMAHMQVWKAPVIDDTGKVVGTQVIFWDVTEKKLAEDNLRQTLINLNRSNQDLEQFAYAASHDLQEPLRMIACYTDLLSKRFRGHLDEEAQEFVRYVVEGAVRMKRLINDLLAYSRLETQSEPMCPAPMDQVLRAALANLQIAIDESCALVTHDDLPEVHGDQIQLIQLVQNLISNALKFRGQESPKIHISSKAKDRHWLFCVRDNGIGIDPEHTEQIFAIFKRLHTWEQYQGTGIGLAICKKIVERHGGQIWVESNPGHGSSFFFTLPMTRES